MAERAAADARIQQQDRQIHELRTRKALGEVMDDLNVPRKVQPACAALVATRLRIEFDAPIDACQDHVAIVRDECGLMSLRSAVDRWLDSPEGRPFRPAAPRPGPFAQMVAAMSAPR